ncbi:integrase arm-type DNA-binding domain-containing protein [Orbus sasakiae]|uniref:Integrase arm-type DNA-binding domain-containing protein n=1 Tax=Orbus sasakiae TaxID=1078475 RepID=A0ABP9N4P2_9GAMM
MPLNDSKIKSAKPKDKKYRLNDGDGLVIVINPNGSKLWNVRYRFKNKECILSLGKYPLITLLEARQLRDKVKKEIILGHDPKALHEKKRSEQNGDFNFATIARKWCDSNRQWSEPHRIRVLKTIETNLIPYIGNQHIASLTTQELLKPIRLVEEQDKTELASRLQQRTNAIMRYAVQNGYINYNPAQDLTGCITKKKTVHRPALEFNQIPELLNRIDNYNGRLITKLAIKLTLLTFIRSSELRFARWSEIDFESKEWTIPEDREAIDGVRYSYRGSKMQTTHKVPLSQQSMDILKQLYEISGDHELIFISDHSSYKPMSENTVNQALRSMGYDTKTELCGHGFRTMACSALVESGLWSTDAIERQMSHQERNKVRAAYTHKSGLINERIQMVQWWADYLDAIGTEFVMPYEFNAA